MAIAPQNSVSTTWQVKSGGLPGERVDEEIVRADVGAVPVGVVRKEDDRWPLVREDRGDDLDGRLPPRRIAVRVLTLMCSRPPGAV